MGYFVAVLRERSAPTGAAVGGSDATIVTGISLNDIRKSLRDLNEHMDPEWGDKLGSICIRKVHFRDVAMTRQIESKVVNRLRQVTTAIKQDGANQVSIIASTAESQAAIEFAKAAAVGPQIVGAALEKISQDPEAAAALFEILETQKTLAGESRITLLPCKSTLLGELLAAGDVKEQTPANPPHRLDAQGGTAL